MANYSKKTTHFRALLVCLAVLLAGGRVYGLKVPAHMDTLVTEAMSALYNLEYDRSETLFGKVIHDYPNEPIPHLFYASYLWWRAAQQFDLPVEVALYERRFEREIDITLELAKRKARRVGEHDEEILFVQGGANGMAGRWWALKGKWLKAYRHGKKGQARLRKVLEINPNLYDAYLGLGIYDYYTATMSGFFKRIAAFLFLRGDKDKGLQELLLAAEKGHFAKTEARLFLIHAYESDEFDYPKALEQVMILRKRFPASPLFHYMEMVLRFDIGEYDASKNLAKDFIAHIDAKEKTYSARMFPLPALFLGNVSLVQKNYKEAVSHLTSCSERGEGAPPAWVSFCILRRGQAYDALGQRESATADYHAVLNLVEFRNTHKDAKKCLESPCSHADTLDSLGISH